MSRELCSISQGGVGNVIQRSTLTRMQISVNLDEILQVKKIIMY